MGFSDLETAPTISRFTKLRLQGNLRCFGRACSPMSPGQSIKNSCCRKRISGGGEPDPERSDQRVGLLLSRRRKGDTGRDRSPPGSKAHWRDVAAAAKSDTILGWYRKLIANKFDGSKFRRSVGRPKADQETERFGGSDGEGKSELGLRSDRRGALANLGHRLSDQTVDNILCRRDDSPGSPAEEGNELERLYPFPPGRFWWAWTLLHDGSPNAQGLTTYYVLFFIHLETRRVNPGGIHAVPGSAVDGATGTKHDHGGVGMPERLSLSAA